MSYTQRLTYEDNNKTLAECLKPTRMTTIVWQLLKTSKYLYDNKSLYNLLTKVNPIFSRLFSCFLIFSRDFAYVSHAGRESSRYCGSLLKFRMIELLPTPEVEEGFVKRDEVLETTRKKVGQHGRVGADCGLHPLIHTLLEFGVAPYVERQSTLLRFWQRTPTNRTHFLAWPYHQVGFALGAFDRMECDSFYFVRV